MSSANNYVNQIMITCYVMEFIYKEHFYQINTLMKTKLVIPCILDSIQKFLGDISYTVVFSLRSIWFLNDIKY